MTSTLTQKEQEFSDALDQTPDDWELRGIYADWLSDQGRDREEACQRWMIENEKRPDKHPTGTWDWWFFKDEDKLYPEYLPSHFKEYFERWNDMGNNYREYPNRQHAERVLCVALTTLGIIP